MKVLMWTDDSKNRVKFAKELQGSFTFELSLHTIKRCCVACEQQMVSCNMPLPVVRVQFWEVPAVDCAFLGLITSVLSMIATPITPPTEAED